MSCEKLNAALAAIAEAREMLLDNSPLDFVPLGLQQLLSLLQGHEVCMWLPVYIAELCWVHYADWAHFSFSDWIHCVMNAEVEQE